MCKFSRFPLLLLLLLCSRESFSTNMGQFCNMIMKKKLRIYLWIPIYTPPSKLCKEKKKLATNPSSIINNLFFWPPTIPPKQALKIWHYKGRTKQKQKLKLKRETHHFVVRCWNYWNMTHFLFTFDSCWFFMFKICSFLPHHSNIDNLATCTCTLFLLTNPYTSCIINLLNAHSYLKIIWTPKEIFFKTILIIIL